MSSAQVFSGVKRARKSILGYYFIVTREQNIKAYIAHVYNVTGKILCSSEREYFPFSLSFVTEMFLQNIFSEWFLHFCHFMTTFATICGRKWAFFIMSCSFFITFFIVKYLSNYIFTHFLNRGYNKVGKIWAPSKIEIFNIIFQVNNQHRNWLCHNDRCFCCTLTFCCHTSDEPSQARKSATDYGIHFCNYPSDTVAKFSNL